MCGNCEHNDNFNAKVVRMVLGREAVQMKLDINVLQHSHITLLTVRRYTHVLHVAFGVATTAAARVHVQYTFAKYNSWSHVYCIAQTA